MNARRRPRLFLDHKPPLVAFTVVAIACALMMVHMARSEATPGWLRAGLDGIVGQRVLEATVLEHDPAHESTIVAAGPLPVGAASGTSAPLAAAPAQGEPAPAEHSSATHGHHAVVGAVVGDVHDASDPVVDTDDATDQDDSASRGNGHGQGRGEHPAPNVTTPNTGPAPQARDHHDWVGDRGRGHGQGHEHGEGHEHGDGRGHDGDRGHRGEGPGHGHHDGGRGHHH